MSAPADAHVDFLRLAIDEAISGVQAREGGPFGAIIARGTAIVARAHNRVTSRPDATAHAEVEAIRAACAALGTHALAGCTLYASCEPCPMCLAAVYWARLDRVYYAATRSEAAAAGFDDARLHDELTRHDTARSVPVVRLPVAEAAAPFKVWTELADRVPY